MSAPAPTEVVGGPLAPLDRSTVRALAFLREMIAEHAYDAVHRLHRFELAPRRLEASLRETVQHAPGATQELLELLSFGTARPRRRLARLFGEDAVAALAAVGLLVEVPEADTLAARYRLDVVGDHLLLVDWPEARAAHVYFGEDSEFLRSMLRPGRGDVCLDLCTGSGVQALRCAESAARVDAVDLNPEAVHLAQLNAELNQLGDRVRVYRGDLWAPLGAAARYDHVFCNPPLVPVPESVPYPLCGHGGADGLQLVRRILAVLSERLTATGRCTLIGASTGTVLRPTVLDEIECSIGKQLHVSLFLMLRVPLRDWVSTVSQTVRAVYPGTVAGNTVLRARAQYGAAFDETFVYTFLLTASRQGAAGCRIFDYTALGQRSYWFVNRDAGRSPGSRGARA